MALAITSLAGEIGGLIYARGLLEDGETSDDDCKTNKTTINQ